MLNYAYVVEAGRLARALTATGFVLPIGSLHSDKHGRNSLVWDAIEPLRPEIDAPVFKSSRRENSSGRTFRKRAKACDRDLGRLYAHHLHQWRKSQTPEAPRRKQAASTRKELTTLPVGATGEEFDFGQFSAAHSPKWLNERIEKQMEIDDDWQDDE
jgi:CRISPR/Cas system-associated endonuclease Cas1